VALVAGPGLGAAASAVAAAPPPISTWGHAEFDRPYGWIAYDATRGVLLATIPSRGGDTDPRLVEVDPITGAERRSVDLGEDPARAVVSPDGTFAWVGTTSRAILKVDLATFTVVESVMLPEGEGERSAGDLELQPGTNDVLAVVIMRHGNPDGLVVYDDFVLRPDALEPQHAQSAITFSTTDPSTLYGTRELSSADLWEYRVTENGVVVETLHRYAFTPSMADIEFAGGLVYNANGLSIDPAGPTLVAAHGDANAVEPMPQTNRVYTMEPKRFQPAQLIEWDLTTHAQIGRLEVSVSGYHRVRQLIATSFGLAALLDGTSGDLGWRLVLAGPAVHEVEPPEFGVWQAASDISYGNPVTVAWRAHDSSGIASYDVQVRRAQLGKGWGRWQNYALGTTSRSVRLRPSMGDTLCVRYRARDGFGNTTTWSPDTRCVSTPQRARKLLSAGQWFYERFRGAFAGEVLIPLNNRSAIDAQIRSRTIVLVYTSCPNCGIVDVFYRGAKVNSIDTRGSFSNRRISLIRSWTTVHSGRVTVRAHGDDLVAIEGLLAPAAVG
jgi:hypothetical protein